MHYYNMHVHCNFMLGKRFCIACTRCTRCSDPHADTTPAPEVNSTGLGWAHSPPTSQCLTCGLRHKPPAVPFNVTVARHAPPASSASLVCSPVSCLSRPGLPLSACSRRRPWRPAPWVSCWAGNVVLIKRLLLLGH